MWGEALPFTCVIPPAADHFSVWVYSVWPVELEHWAVGELPCFIYVIPPPTDCFSVCMCFGWMLSWSTRQGQGYFLSPTWSPQLLTASLSLGTLANNRTGAPGWGRGASFCLHDPRGILPCSPYVLAWWRHPYYSLATSVWDFPMGYEGTWRVKVFPQWAAPPHLLSESCTAPHSVLLPLGEGEENPFPPWVPAPPSSDLWLQGSLRDLLCCVNILCWYEKVLFILS